MNNSDKKFSILIHEISLQVSRLFNQKVKEMGLTRSQWMVLYLLYSEGVQSQTMLAANLSIAKQPLGKVVDKLEKDGWVTRVQNKNDKREKLVAITDKVTPIVNPLSEIVEGIDQLAFASFTADERRETIDKLMRVKASLMG